MDNPKDFEEDENKLSKEELDALLEEVENDSRQVVRREQPVKKKNIRFDFIMEIIDLNFFTELFWFFFII